MGAGPGLRTVTVNCRPVGRPGDCAARATDCAVPVEVVTPTRSNPTEPLKFWKNAFPETGFSTTTTYRHRPGIGLATVFCMDSPCLPEPSGAALVEIDGVSPS